MHNISNHVFKYIANITLDYYNEVNVEPGERYELYLESLQHVKEQYFAIKTAAEQRGLTTGIIYFDEQIEDAQALDITLDNGSRLIILYTSKNVDGSFLTTKRNEVAAQTPPFENTVSLFIHDTELDSITGGALSLLREGMPLHVKSIVKHLKKDLEETEKLSKGDKKQLTYLLDKKKDDVFQDNSSFFDYGVFLDILSQEKIAKETLKKLHLFQDKELSLMQNPKEKEVQSRVDENLKLYEQIETAHLYGNVEDDLQKYFTESDIKKVKSDDWWERDFSEVQSWKESKSNNEPPEILQIKLEESSLYYELWESNDGDTPAKSRRNNILIFNSHKKTEDIKVKIDFSQVVKSSGLSSKDGDKLKVSAPGKSIVCTIKMKEGEPTPLFIRAEYKDPDSNAKFIFRFAVISFSSHLLKNIQPIYRLSSKEIILDTEDDTLVFNSGHENRNRRKVVEGGSYEIETNTELELDFSAITEAKTKFTLKKGSSCLAFRYEFTNYQKPKVISGIKVLKGKLENQQSFYYTPSTEKLRQGSSEYFAREEFRANLTLESQILELSHKYLYWEEDKQQELHGKDLSINDDLKKLYVGLMKYLKSKDLLPSLAYLDDTVRRYYEEIVQHFIKELKSIEDNRVLTRTQTDLAKVGVIKELNGKRRVKYTPFHPLNMAYQLQLDEKLEGTQVEEEVLKRLNSLNLVPHIYWENKSEYLPTETSHSPEWSYYTDRALSKSIASKRYVKRLVSSKLEEFKKHFSYLFPEHTSAPIRINLVNQGDCAEILQGVFDFYKGLIQPKDGISLEDLPPIDINIYGSEALVTKFEELSSYDDIDRIKEDFEIEFPSDSFPEIEVLNAYRDKVHFYTKDMDSLDYAHISFYQFNEEQVSFSYAKMDKMPTGISLDGLMSDVPSILDGNSYRTGFGTNYLASSNPLIDFAKRYNALVCSAFTEDPFAKDNAICSVIQRTTKEHLYKLYKYSQWVTFIDPKVDLTFFDTPHDDLIIIHYSDQYNNASGYDAITVTQKSKQYQHVIEGFLREKGVDYSAKNSLNILSIFNAINGEWLLKLIAKKYTFSKEKISILSAVKIALALFYHPNIIWIPISLEEILRISGSVGLRKSEGFLSSNLNKQAASDDLLLIGVEDINNEVFLHFYPIEVKIGVNNTSVIDKAIKQGKATAKILKDTLTGTDYNTEIYKNFFAKLALVSAQKMSMYGIWPEQDWDKITTTLRQQIMHNEFKIGAHLEKHIGSFAVMSFRTESFTRKLSRIKEGILVELLEHEDGHNGLVKSVENFKQLYFSDLSTIPKDDLLSSIYTPTGEPKPKTEQKTEHQPTPKPQPNNSFEPLSILFGYDVKNLEQKQPVKWYPTSTDKVLHTNTGIIGTMGTGKTQFTKSLIYQLVKEEHRNVNGTPLGILIFDYKGDYVKEEFTSVTNAKVLQPFHLPYNPLAIPLGKKNRNLLPLHIASTIKETIATVYGLGPKQKRLLQEILLEAYEARGIKRNDPKTWTQTAPTIAEACSIYFNQEKLDTDSLYAALGNLKDYELFEPDASKSKSLYDILDGVVVINLETYDPGLQNLVVALTLDLFYSQMQNTGHSVIKDSYRELTKFVLVDEADNFLSQGFNSIKKILKEGREYGVGTILSTQFLDHFSNKDNDYSNYVLTWIIHRVNEIKKREVKALFKTNDNAKVDELEQTIKSLKKHYSLINLAGSDPIHIKDKAFWEWMKELKQDD